jgi:hypothetical protein
VEGPDRLGSRHGSESRDVSPVASRRLAALFSALRAASAAALPPAALRSAKKVISYIVLFMF